MTTAKLGITGIALVAVLLVAAVTVPHGWYILRTTSYTAQFENAGGLTDADPVYLAGVPAGRVDSVELAGDHVDVHFRLDRDRPLGDRTRAAVKLRTILGKRYLEIVPDGNASADRVIPLARTTVPYTLDEIGTETVTAAEELDVPALEQMVATLRETTPTDSSVFGDALTGVSAASAMLARNDEQISGLLDASRSLSTAIAAESASLADLLGNAQTVLGILADRRTALSRLVADLRTLIDTASTFLGDNTDELDHLLVNMRSVTDTLDRNGQNIDALMSTLPAGLRAVTDATGNGNWVDVSAPAGPVPDNLLCALGVMQGCTG
ncbi:MCE family protein [Rhodococcoides kyotonense]|uniref:Phospholipid/cholesterol/gamma-HCH transport system substrate-binding protein n=1 Tax=Rhodococcoides kyotonense TaxID=398843 RepID=A0A239F8V0_9NOCA|nr:MCE family protein [Rhodococcus kyotonensis]SNS53227.1 phospholipid/cholesterol/gamma-HCH transport system substrate-binding protein [Rhodococcus kyotonensis]